MCSKPPIKTAEITKEEQFIINFNFLKHKLDELRKEIEDNVKSLTFIMESQNGLNNIHFGSLIRTIDLQYSRICGITESIRAIESQIFNKKDYNNVL